MERVADYFFISSLLGIATIILLLVFHFGK